MNMDSTLVKWYGQHEERITELAKSIWQNPEPPMEEFVSAGLLKDFFTEQGFRIKQFHCRDADKAPNTIIAEWGSGSPVIGIIGEYDALLGLGQEATSTRSPKEGCGHGCGHCLMGAGCAGAAAAVKAVMEEEKFSGTLRFLGCPAEESGEGKLYLLKAGVFEGLDCVFAWHPMGYDGTPYEGVLQAITNMVFSFHGKAAHAAIMPEMGRSALDAAELMNVGVQYLREHVTPDVRMHYTYLAAGDRPNIVPDYAALHYFIRAKDMKTNAQVVERVKKVAEGAAMMTETTLETKLVAASSQTFIVHSINRFLYESAKKVPLPEYSAEEWEFAKQLYEEIMEAEPPDDLLPTKLVPPTGKAVHVPGSTDVGYVTYQIPTGRLFGLGILKGLPVHHWGVTATVGMSIGHKAALFAGKALAQCICDCLREPEVIATWKAELQEVRQQQGEFTIQLP